MNAATGCSHQVYGARRLNWPGKRVKSDGFTRCGREATRLGASAPAAAVVGHADLTSILRTRNGSLLGRWTSSTPSLIFASILPTSTDESK